MDSIFISDKKAFCNVFLTVFEQMKKCIFIIDICSVNMYTLVGWLFVLGVRPFETVFQSTSGRLPERGRKKRNETREKMSKQPPPAPTASAVGPCPTLIQISSTVTETDRTKLCRPYLDAISGFSIELSV